MTSNHKRYVLPAEWHRQACVQLTWPHKDTDWSPYLEDITETFLQLSKAIAHYEPLVIAAKYPEEVREMLSNNLNEEEMNRVSIYECDNNDTWARDHAFITIIPADDESPTTETSDAESTACRLLDFRFNGWGEKFAADKDNLINRTLYSKGVFRGERADYDDFVLEGGSIESDGKGTVLTTSICLMAPHRNQPMTLEEVGQTLKERLCARKVVWLNHGQLIGDDTDGHIDTIVRVCPDMWDVTMRLIRSMLTSAPLRRNFRLLRMQTDVLTVCCVCQCRSRFMTKTTASLPRTPTSSSSTVQ